MINTILLSTMSALALIASATGSQGNCQTKEVASPHLWSECYDDLGCVNNTEEWYDRLLRPVMERPLPRHIIKTTFILFNKEEPEPHYRGRRSAVNVEQLSPIGEQIRASKFDENKSRTHLLIHDFTSNGMAGWVKHAVKSLLAIDAGNIISVDWTGGAEPPYSIAVQNSRLVALEAAALLQTILNEFVDMTPDQFHLIGQGLGAHVAGYVGQKINGIGRITGLDPVGLYFKDMPPSTRLDRGDAKFVDIINTDVEKGQGSGDPLGHFNFFPNGGLTQSGCNASSHYPKLNKMTREMLKEGQTAPGCNHKRAAKYFTATIDERNDNCTPMGYACSDYQAFKRAECVAECTEAGFTCSPMGYFIDFIANSYSEPAETVNFYLDTNDYRPYCMFAYKIIIALAGEVESSSPRDKKTTTSTRTMSGMFLVTVFSETASEDTMFRAKLNPDGIGQKLLNVDGDNVFLTYQKPPKITKPEKIILRFEHQDNETTAAYVRHVGISNLPDYGNSSEMKFCGSEEITLIKNYDSAVFTPCHCDATKPELISNKGSHASYSLSDMFAFRQRRYCPEDNELPSSADQSIDVTDYDESEPPEPAEDDYYSNR